MSKDPEKRLIWHFYECNHFDTHKLNDGIESIIDDKATRTFMGSAYPGPGLLPAEGRFWYIGLGVKL